MTEEQIELMREAILLVRTAISTTDKRCKSPASDEEVSDAFAYLVSFQQEYYEHLVEKDFGRAHFDLSLLSEDIANWRSMLADEEELKVPRLKENSTQSILDALTSIYSAKSTIGGILEVTESKNIIFKKAFDRCEAFAKALTFVKTEWEAKSLFIFMFPKDTRQLYEDFLEVREVVLKRQEALDSAFMVLSRMQTLLLDSPESLPSSRHRNGASTTLNADYKRPVFLNKTKGK